MLPTGYIVALACGPLRKQRYINPKIEKELAEFKDEILEKFTNSDMNKTFAFPRVQEGARQEGHRRANEMAYPSTKDNFGRRNVHSGLVDDVDGKSDDEVQMGDVRTAKSVGHRVEKSCKWL